MLNLLKFGGYDVVKIDDFLGDGFEIEEVELDVIIVEQF